MKRRHFLTSLAAVSAGATGGFGMARSRNAPETAGTNGNIERLGGMSLELWRERYRAELFDRFLPNMDQSVIDHEYGGFICHVDIRTGERLSTGKRAWYEGRGMWTYGFLYNEVEQDSRYLEVADRSREFILKHRPTGDDFWISSFSREGEPISAQPGDIYGSLFIAEGLAQLARATGNEETLDYARRIMLHCLARYDRPDYAYHIAYLSPDAPRIPGVRVLGHWMVFLIGATQFLQIHSDPEIERLADRCVEAIMEHHLHPEYRLLNEGLAHDLTRPDNEFAQFAYLGHGIETLWMVMYEAIRRRDSSLFHEAADAFRRHVTVAHDAVYGGYFRSLDHVDNYTWKVDKVLWLQEEVLIGSLMLIEHLNDPWAHERFVETDTWVREKFVRPGYKFWSSAGDRTVFEHNTSRAEHYHHPRHLMMNLLALDRILARGGKPSGLIS